MIRIKICGLKRECDVDFVNEFLPDYIGFIFANTKRYISPELAKKLKSRLDRRIKAVGVFVNEDINTVCGIADSGIIDLIQLHGDEDEAYINAVKERTGREIIKAVRVQSTQQVLKAEKLPCDYLLLDVYRKGQYGGIGESFNWGLIPKLSKPFFLAGGLNSGNILSAQNQVQPYCLDLSTGVEENGFKSRDKIEEIIKLIRSEK
ncbi:MULTISPECIES: phosphoribosylanthranilate isomerase [unclassified Ruminococcus]|uniref:phosphoribosylanthranilate isomerase n=1 Tax=unclassified Ruminococcus TaxID=2608920 RepID=UPI0021087F84|nr:MULTISPECIES: phosphoribosylanthranilate isomerase [unclassified Ruminococcus]MCQ4022750.1 phosphoribosylanthranilate isomerase [Ruminococcus sp. zg-924]MCQ4114990.1 phosphoribosylanthranilate isomerase [Ruminococcus sp. zg-921]